MRLGILLRYTGEVGGPRMDDVLEAERLGYDSVWAGESYGTDAVTPIAWVLARTSKIKAGTGIMQMSARTPTCAAMTAATLQAMSQNRFLLGIGPSGPQVIEGWHGMPYGKPLTRTREYVAVVRKVFAREVPLEHQGEHYQIPYAGPGATSLGKPLKSILRANPSLKIYTAAISPAGLRTAGEVADGVQPIFMSPERPQLVSDEVLAGMALAGGSKSLADFDIAPFVRVAMGADLAACRDRIRPEMALYVGGMGARSKNFYNDLVKRMGYEDAAIRIQDAFLAGRRQEAAAAVPDALIDETALVGPPERIKDRLAAWKDAGKDRKVGSMLLGGASPEALRLIAETVL
jgi:F420-dependent oxidoreductase-like protein